MDILLSLKSVIKHNPVLMDHINSLAVARYVKIFSVPDFVITKTGLSRYRLNFTDKFGYVPKGYQSEFRYDPTNLTWEVKIGKIALLSATNPIFQLINELRGYLLLNNLKSGDIVIDVGASDGFITNYFAKKVGSKGRVIALEPDTTLQWIEKSKNIVVIPACLAKQSGQTIFSFDTFGASHIDSKGVTVTAISFNDLIQSYPKAKITYIKLDIEGAEIDIIDDLLAFTAKNLRVVIAIASYHKVNGEETWKTIEAKARAHPEVFAKTVYPYHATTYLLNPKNRVLIQKLKSLPSFQEIYPQVWPFGEN